MKARFVKPGGKIKTREKRLQLKDVPPGTLFRYAITPFSVAKKTPSQSLFWRIGDIGSSKTGRVNVMTFDMKMILERDDDHEVIVHAHEVEISPAAIEPIPEQEDQSDTK